MSHFDDLLSNGELIVCLGAGGVGKTTCSLALAVNAAKQGRKVALLSIDPAKRLADALGIPLASELSDVSLPEIKAAGGRLQAAMLDQKVVFDEMVRRYAGSQKNQERILKHPLYVSASSKFGGALEYMALAKVMTMMESQAYDLIVLDTPPDAHALDFLERPAVLAGFMDSKVMTWIIKPIHLAQKAGFSRLVSFGEKLAGGIAEVTGFAALRVLADFLVLMQDVIEGFNQAGRRVVEALRSPSTKFVVITTLRAAPVRTAANIADQLVRREFSFDFLLVNRCLPDDVVAAAKAHQAAESTPSMSMQALLNSCAQADELRRKLERDVYPLMHTQEAVLYFSEQSSYDVHTRAGVSTFADSLSPS